MSSRIFKKGQLNKYWGLFLTLSLVSSILFVAFTLGIGEYGQVAPDNDTWVIGANGINLTCAVDGLTEIHNLSIFTNMTGAWALNVSNSTNVSNQSRVGFNLTFPDGNFNWTCSVGNASHASGVQYNLTSIIKSDSTSPITAFVGPNNNTFNSSSTVAFRFKVTENNLAYCDFYTNLSGSWAINYTSNASNFSSLGYNFSLVEMHDGSYGVNLSCKDQVGLRSGNATFWTVNIDAVAPVINSINTTGNNDGTGNWSAQSNIVFYANVSDQNSDSCTIYTNASGGVMTNKTNTTFSYSGNALSASSAQIFADGSYLFNATCNDSAGNRDYTYGVAVIFNVDTVAPTVAISGPLNDSFNTSSSIKFSFTVNDNNLANCSLWSNASGSWTRNYSASAAALSAEGYNFSIVNMHDGSYHYNVSCSDSASNYSRNATFRTINIDTVAPQILNVTPNASSIIQALNSSNIFRFNIREANLNSSSATYNNFSIVFRKSFPSTTAWQNETGGNLNSRACTASGIANIFNCSADVNLGSLDSGEGTVIDYYLRVNDVAANYGSNGSAESPIQFSLDKTAPLINAINSTGYARGIDTMNWSSSNDPTFYVNATENNTDSCTVYTNMTGSWVANSSYVFAYTSNALSSSGSVTGDIHDGSYAWNVTCNDSSGRADISYGNSIILNIDTTAPVVTLSSPANNSYNQSGTVKVRFAVTESNLDWCTLYTNATGSFVANYSATASALTAEGNNFTLTSMHDSTYLWNIKCNDSASNTGVATANNTFVVDSVNPVVNFINASGYNSGTAATALQNWTSSNDPTFFVNVTDDNYVFNNTCTVYSNMTGSWVANSSYVFQYTSNALSTSGSVTGDIHDGSYGWNVTCNDSSNRGGQYYPNVSANSPTGIVINIDSTSPVVTITSPQNKSYNNSATVKIGFSVTENNLVNCSLFTDATGSWVLNATINASAINTSATNNTFTLSNMHDANYTINVSCSDIAGNYGSGIPNYSIVIDTTAPVFSNQKPLNGTLVSSGTSIVFNITVTETNINTTVNPSTNFPVRGGARAFFKEDSGSNFIEVNLTCAASPNAGVYYCSNTTVNAGLTDGNILLYYYNFSDAAGWSTSNGSASSPLRATVDEVTPVINYIASNANDTNFGNYGGNWTTGNVTFYVNATDSNAAQCVMFTNASPGIGNNLSANVTLTYTSNVLSKSVPQVFGDGSYRMNATCNDSAGRIDSTYGAIIIFNVDSTAPVVALKTPLDGSFNRSSSNNINITFTVTENNLDACSLYTNYTGSFVKNYTANASQLTAQGYNFSFVSARDGKYVWNVRCNDTAGNGAINSSNYTITIDTVAPVISSLNMTGFNKGYAADNWSNSGNITFYVNVTDANADSCVIFTNVTTTPASIFNLTANTTFAYKTGELNASATQVYPDGSYRLNVTCNDSAGNRDDSFSGNSTIFNVDTKDPTVSITSPVSGSYNLSNILNITFQQTEANLDTCVLWTNSTGTWSKNQTLLASAINATGNTFVIGPVSDGRIMFNITCNDSSGRYNHNATDFIINVDSTAPVINFFNSTGWNKGNAADNWSSNGNITFYVNVSDANVDTCTVFSNVTAAPASIFNLTANTSFTYTSNALSASSAQVFPDGSFRLNISCNDSAGNRDNSFSANSTILNIDTATPIVGIRQPVNNSVNTTSAIVNITFAVTDNNADVCSLYTNQTGSWALDHSAVVSSVWSSQPYNLSFRPSTDGSYQVNITCNDSAGRQNQNNTFYVVNVDANAPVINFVNATGYNNNGNRSTTRTVTFFVNATDSSPDKCLVYTNMTGSWVANESSLITWTANALNATGSLTFSSDLHVNWNITCNDTANNKGNYAVNQTLRIDTLAPKVRLLHPVNASVNTTQAMIFEYNVTEENAGETSSCQLYSAPAGTALSLKYTNSSISASDSHDREAGLIHASGNHIWNVRCNDSAGNIGWNSTNLTFTIETGDVNINYSQTLATRGWNTLWVPTTTIMGTFGMTSGNTQGWNMSYVLSTRGKLNNNYNIVYYNTDGTDSGWKSFNINDWAGSSLKYINNTNDKPYWINTSVSNVTFVI